MSGGRAAGAPARPARHGNWPGRCQHSPGPGARSTSTTLFWRESEPGHWHADRNRFIALGTRNVLASALAVGEVARHGVWTCAPDDDIQAALDIMSQRRIRRLPTVEANGHLVGIVSMNDIVLAIGGARAVPQGHVIDTLQEISAHHHLPSVT